MAWNSWDGRNSWGTYGDSWGSDSRAQEAEASGVSRIAKKAWDMCVQLGGTAKISMSLDERLRLINHMIPSLRKMKLLTMTSEQADAIIFIASGQQPDLRIKLVADTMDVLMDMFKEEYMTRKDTDAAGLREMIEGDSSKLVPYAKDMCFLPFEAASGPTP